MVRQPLGMELDILRQLIADGHGMYKTEFPVAYLNQCIQCGWVRADNHGFAHITEAGREMYRLRK